MQRYPAFDVLRDIPFVLCGYCSGGTEILPINVSLNEDVNCKFLLECDNVFKLQID